MPSPIPRAATARCLRPLALATFVVVPAVLFAQAGRHRVCARPARTARQGRRQTSLTPRVGDSAPLLRVGWGWACRPRDWGTRVRELAIWHRSPTMSTVDDGPSIDVARTLPYTVRTGRIIYANRHRARLSGIARGRSHGGALACPPEGARRIGGCHP